MRGARCLALATGSRPRRRGVDSGTSEESTESFGRRSLHTAGRQRSRSNLGLARRNATGQIGNRLFWKRTMNERREKRKRWVQRGQYAVEVEIDVIFPADDTSEPCLEPQTVRWLDEIAQKAQQGDVEYLRKV